MDCNMPIMNGFDASKKITDLITQNKIKPLHILALTANQTSTSNNEIDQ